MDRIESAIKELPKTPQPDTGCPKGQDNRQSDLCAQWKAADAASDAAWWAMSTFWVGAFGLIVGAGTLLAAGFAAWYAKRAADEAHRTANEAERSRISFLEGERAHLSFQYASSGRSEDRLTIFLNLRNNGKCPGEIDGLAFEVVDGEVWPDAPLDLADGLQVKIAQGDGGTVRYSGTIPSRLPTLVVGYVRYNTLTLTDCRTYFGLVIDKADTSLGGEPFHVRTVEPLGQPADT